MVDVVIDPDLAVPVYIGEGLLTDKRYLRVGQNLSHIVHNYEADRSYLRRADLHCQNHFSGCRSIGNIDLVRISTQHDVVRWRHDDVKRRALSRRYLRSIRPNQCHPRQNIRLYERDIPHRAHALIDDRDGLRVRSPGVHANLHAIGLYHRNWDSRPQLERNLRFFMKSFIGVEYDREANGVRGILRDRHRQRQWDRCVRLQRPGKRYLHLPNNVVRRILIH